MKKIKMFFSFRYTRFMISIMLFCIISLLVYYVTYHSQYMLVSNIFGNIFAGLIASVVIAIYSNMRTEDLKKITDLIQEINDINDEIYKYLKKYNSNEIAITQERVEKAFSEYTHLNSVLYELNNKYERFNFQFKPQPVLGDPDDCVKEYIEKISFELYVKNDKNYEEYLDFMVNSSSVMLHQNTYVINYLLMYFNVCNKFPL